MYEVSQAYFNADYFALCWCLRAAYTILSIARNEIIRRGRRDAGNGVKPRARGGGKTPKKVFPSQQTLGRVRRSPRPPWVLVPHPATASPRPPLPPAYPAPLRVRPLPAHVPLSSRLLTTWTLWLSRERSDATVTFRNILAGSISACWPWKLNLPHKFCR